MTVPSWVKPGIWGGILGAAAIMFVGFWQMGWTTAGDADRMATDRANFAVVTVLIPLCVAKAEQDPDQAKLAKVKAEKSPYDRSKLVSDAGWATLPGATAPADGLAHACSEKLRGPNAQGIVAPTGAVAFG